MFDEDYRAELSYVREMGRAFASKHPALAGMLAEPSTDPDVERLLEGFAFVATRLRQRIDDAMPELVESLAELLLPHALLPVPAATIVEFRACPGQRHRTQVAPGTKLLSKPARGTRCTFSTTRALDVLPLRLSALRLDDSVAAKPELTLRLEAEPGSADAIFGPTALRFHLHGERAATTQLYLWLARHVCGVSLRDRHGATVELGARSVRLDSFDDDQSLLPWPPFAAQSLRLLSEYFTLLPKFLFFEIGQLERARHLSGEVYELALRFADPPGLPGRLSLDMLRMHCVPAVNLFDAGAEPIRVDLDERPVLLRVAGLQPEHAEVFSVQSVVGSCHRAERKKYEPFHTFRHALQKADAGGYYKLARRPSPVDAGAHTFMSVHRASGASLVRDRETLSVELCCTNRDLPTELQLGDIATPTSDLPAGLTFSDIAPLAPGLRAPLGQDLLWHLLSCLGCTRRSLADREVLQAMLTLYGGPPASLERRELPERRASRAKIEAIRSVRAETITRALGGLAARGSRYRVELDQAGFASEGDAFLFAALLQRVFALDAQVNTFADLCVIMRPSGVRWRFDAEHAR
jgi:type VI secretion system protein ImpG